MIFQTRSKEIERWEVESGELISLMNPETGAMTSTSERVTYLASSPVLNGALAAVFNGRTLVSTTPDGVITTLIAHPFGVSSGQREEFYQADFTPDGRQLVVAAEIVALSKGPFDMVNERTVAAEAEVWDIAFHKVMRRCRDASPCYFSQVWQSADGKQVLVLRHPYSRAPLTAAERQGQQLQVSKGAMSLVLYNY